MRAPLIYHSASRLSTARNEAVSTRLGRVAVRRGVDTRAVTRRGERLEPLTGVLAVLLWLIGIFLLEKDDRPDGKDTAAFVAWVEENDTAILIGAITFAFGVLLFLWMLGCLREALVSEDRGAERLAVVGFGAGVGVSVCLVLTYLPHAQAAFDHANTSATSVDALVRVGDAFFFGAALFAVPMLVATGLATLRFGALPRWLGWFGLVVAVVLAVPPVAFFGIVLGLPVWTVLVAVALYRRGSAASRSS
jgi:hypothetical protein